MDALNSSPLLAWRTQNYPEFENDDMISIRLEAETANAELPTCFQDGPLTAPKVRTIEIVLSLHTDHLSQTAHFLSSRPHIVSKSIDALMSKFDSPICIPRSRSFSTQETQVQLLIVMTTKTASSIVV